MYDVGEGVPEDNALAIKWYTEAGEQGHENAQLNLGIMYENGEGTEVDTDLAMKWYRRAADQGLTDAQYAVALMFDEGVGVDEDNVAALAWYLRAAEQGDPDAQNNLGAMYDAGEGISEDNAEAVKWYALAADQGILARCISPAKASRKTRSKPTNGSLFPVNSATTMAGKTAVLPANPWSSKKSCRQKSWVVSGSRNL
jgi:TPR repeat protein